MNANQFFTGKLWCLNKYKLGLNNQDEFNAEYHYGLNSAVDTTKEDLWNKGGLYTGYFASGTTVDVSSDSTDDDDGGAGAWSVVISGLDGDWGLQEETLLLDGTNKVTSSNSWIRVFSATVYQGGNALNANVGNITVEETGTPANIAAYIAAGHGGSSGAFCTIPADYVGLVLNADTNVGKGKDAEVSLSYRRNDIANGVFIQLATRQVYQNSFIRLYDIPRIVPEKTDLKMSATSSAATPVSGSLEVLLVRKDFHIK